MTKGHKWGLTVTRRDGSAISVAGRLSRANAPRLAEALAASIHAGDRQIVVDLSELDYVSSAGLGVLRDMSARLGALGGGLGLTGAQPPVRIALDLAGIGLNGAPGRQL